MTLKYRDALGMDFFFLGSALAVKIFDHQEPQELYLDLYFKCLPGGIEAFKFLPRLKVNGLDTFH